MWSMIKLSRKLIKKTVSKIETEKQAIKRYRRDYAQDQNDLYKNKIVKFIFDMGHKFISKNGESNKGVFLDIGSGIGYHLNFENTSKKKKYICLDIDPKTLKLIKDKRVTKIKASCESIPLESNSVDVVIASHVLEHVPDLDKCLIEVKRVLVKNGLFLVVLPCDPGFLWDFLTKFTPSRKRLEKAKLDYDLIMQSEHVNTFQKCLDKLPKHFSIKSKIYYPFFIPDYNLNLLCGLKLVNNKGGN